MSKEPIASQQPDIAAIARAAGLTVVLDGKIGRQEYQSVSGGLAALQRFAEAYYEPAGETAKLVERLLNRAALQFEDDDAQVMREAARVLQRHHYVQLARQASEPDIPAPFPNELTAELREVLGWPNFRCGPVAHLMRAAGAEIQPKAEDEQAVVLHWFVKLVLKHGADWWSVARAELTDMQRRVTEAANVRPAESPDAPQAPPVSDGCPQCDKTSQAGMVMCCGREECPGWSKAGCRPDEVRADDVGDESHHSHLNGGDL